MFPPLFLLVLGLCWTFASPLGSAPDEDFHLTTIWCLEGENNLCNVGINDSRKVPALWSSWPPCYVNWPKSDKSAGCLTRLELPLQLVATKRYSRPGEDPVLFYQVMNFFAGDNPINSVNFMRIFNVTVASFMFFLAIYVAPFIVKRALILTWGLIIVPIGIFNIASTNPSSWTITGIGTLWSFILSSIFYRNSRSKMFYLSIFGLLISMTLSLGSRGDSRIYLVVTFISLTLLFLNKTILIRYSKILIASALSILLIVLVFLNRFWITIFDSWYFINAKQESDQPNAFVTLMLDFPAFFFSLTGGQSPSFDQNRGALFDNFSAGISWSDFNFPSIVGILLGSCLISLISLSIKGSSWQKISAICWIFLAILSIIIYSKGRYPDVNDAQITPRYMLPLFLILIGITLLVDSGSKPLIGKIYSGIILILSTIGGSLAWLVTISRFSIGPNAAFTNFWQTPEWWALSPAFSRLEFFTLATITTFFWYLSTIYVWGGMKESNEPTFIKTLNQ